MRIRLNLGVLFSGEVLVRGLYKLQVDTFYTLPIVHIQDFREEEFGVDQPVQQSTKP